MKYLLRCSGFVWLALWLGSAASNAAPRVEIVPSRTLPFRFTVPPSAQTNVVEATTNFLNWVAVQTVFPSASSVTVTDTTSSSTSRRFYRLRAITAELPELASATNSVFMPPDGFNTVQFASNGKLGLLVWRGQDLVYRERSGTAWSEQVIGHFGKTYVAGATEEYRFQPPAALHFDSQSFAHIVWLNGSSVRHHVQQSNGTFAESGAISLSGLGSSFTLFASAMGPGNKLHLAVAGGSNSPLSYGSNKSGAWQWTTVTNLTGNPRGFLKQSWAPRWFSLAVDSNNDAHLTFCPQFSIGRSPEGYARPYSSLFYASNRGGAWLTQLIADVADQSGDAGAGASIAIGPNNQPAIAAWYNERFPTGSSLACQLNYYSRNTDGSWNQQLVSANAAGYLAGDGDKGTGFAPYLRFDSLGRPNIAFCDDAAEHFPSSGQNEYAGNLRHAVFDGANWAIRTVYAQSNALDAQIVYPAFATLGGETVFMGLDRRTVWAQPDYRVATSTYNFFFVSLPLL